MDESTVARTTDRRTFLSRITAGTVAATAAITTAGATAGIASLAIPEVAAAAPREPHLHPEGHSPLGGPWDETWLTKLTGKHKQFFDAVSPNEGFSLGFAMNFLDQYNQVYKIPDAHLTAVVGLRHFAIPLAFNDAIWAKYKLGEFMKITDPATKAPAVRNIYNYDDGVMLPGSTVSRLVHRGVMLTLCNVALTIGSGLAADAAGVPKEGAAAEWLAGMLPGVTLVPVGVIAVNRAQEKGCTYCNAG